MKTIRRRYREYRSYGHTVWCAAMLAIPPEYFWGGVGVVFFLAFLKR
jgi:hypothetical protein